MYRIHRRIRGAWWFSSDGSQRFDPTGSPGLGACYAGETELAAWVEVFRTTMVIDERDVQDRVISRLVLGRPLRLADLTDRAALAHGVTGSLTGGTVYAEAQTLATDAANAGFDGVRWHVRHDPAHVLVGVAIFGPREADWPSTAPEDISEALIAAAAREFRYLVIPRPL